MSSTEQLDRLKARRKGHRGVVTKLLREGKSLMDGESTAATKERLKTIYGLLEEKSRLLRELDGEVLDLSPTEEIEEEIIHSDELKDKISETMKVIAVHRKRPVSNSSTPELEDHQEDREENSSTTRDTEDQSAIHQSRSEHESTQPPPILDSSLTGQGKGMPKLPKLIIPRFSGEITKFRSFWDSFDSAIHKNSTLSAVDKFNYLHALLEGPAAKAIQGLALSEANYVAAIEILQDRFGKTQQIISAHMDELLKLPICSGDRTSQLRSIYDKISINIRGLESLGVRSDQYGSFLIPVIMSKLPLEVRLQVARLTTGDVWEVEELLHIIKREVVARELSDTIRANERNPPPPQRRPIVPTSSSLVANDQGGGRRIICVFCKGEHYSAACEKVATVMARRDALLKEGRCFLCLSVGHRASQCSSSRRCRKCGRPHHQAICNPPAPRNTTPSEGTAQNNTTTTTVRTKGKVLLQTARTSAYTSGGDLVPVRVLLDNGSQRSYLTHKLRSQLKLQALRQETVNLNTFGEESFKKRKCDVVHFRLQGADMDIDITALVFPTICSPMNVQVDIDHYSHLQGIELADHFLSDNDNQLNPDDAIDILIGSDYYWDVVTGDIIRGNGGPVAIHSKFGWLVSGPLKGKGSSVHNVVTELIIEGSPVTNVSCDENTELVHSLKQFWETESIGITERSIVPQAESKFPPDATFDMIEGRYRVGLPWKSCKPSFSNYSLCVTRLQKLRARLRHNSVLLQQYDSIFNQQVESRIIEPVPASELNAKLVHFLPHHGVVREDKDTTKLRIVFDGSAQSEEQKYSLNDCLERGPNLTPHIFSVLVRFRSYRIGITADIEKAFHQILVNTEDRDMLRFLWWDDVSNENPKIQQYRFCRLVFGLTPSPAILNGVIQHHLDIHKRENPATAKLISDSLYVDDFLGGSQRKEEGFKIYQQAMAIMKSGGFILRKWTTNCKELQDQINQAESSISNTQLEDSVKILGVKWNTQDDYFFFELSEITKYMHTLPPTKRSLLKVSAKIFDPLGLLSPFSIRIKIAFQQLCLNKKGWDENLEGEHLRIWKHLDKELETLNCIKVPRCYVSPDQPILHHELHGFSDASEKAYAAVVYLRTVYSDGETVTTSIIAAKNRVAPLKKQTIPRLELLGATILARLLKSVKSELEPLINLSSSYHWVDSFTTLCWIKNERRWKQYVQHRVDEIRRNSDKSTWKFCPGSDNPADLPSRSADATSLINNTLWWNGPAFLMHSPESWPDLPTQFDSGEADKELIRNAPVVTHSLTVAAKGSTMSVDLEQIMTIKNFGSRNKLLRTTSYILRFIALLKNTERVDQTEVTAAEFSLADCMWTQTIQASSFTAELQRLNNGESYVPLKQLMLYLDKSIIRCHGRINQSALSASSKNPILLPPDHYFTELLIKERHKMVHHDGIRETLSAVRETHWIPRGRAAVKRVIRSCVVCRRFEGRPYSSPMMPDLPPERVSEGPPFAHTGVDFAGPLYVKSSIESDDKAKTYICLFTCATTRAVHLELTEALSAQSFLQAFRRFVSRRGLPSVMMSDNAKTFKSVSKDIKKIRQSKEVQQHLTSRQVDWQFILEKAPWWGGFWERLVQSTKRCLKKTIGRTTLTYEELRTVVIEIESTLNNRPLTYIYDDAEGNSRCLTPADLIYGYRLSSVPSERQYEVTSTSQCLTKRARYQFRLLAEFNRQWKRDYLLSLREYSAGKNKGSRTAPAIKRGDIVILKDEHTARCWWKLARVTELLEGRDKKVRAAKIWVLSSERKPVTLRRPIQSLIPLEVRSQESS